MSSILVVDDVAPLAEQYAYDLARLGAHEVRVVTSGAVDHRTSVSRAGSESAG